jgi:galactose-1-phosphate uridylyltransferase
MPEIEMNDDVFKRVIKHALQEKKISLKACRDRFKNDYDITNMKQALRKDSMLSNAYLHKWAEVLDLHITINVSLVSSDGKRINFEEQMR